MPVHIAAKGHLIIVTNKELFAARFVLQSTLTWFNLPNSATNFAQVGARAGIIVSTVQSQ
jgi:hypothetical protein